MEPFWRSAVRNMSRKVMGGILDGPWKHPRLPPHWLTYLPAEVITN
jgi:hypothetical protein